MFLVLMCGLVLLFMVGIADDLVGVNYKRKFIVQIFAAAYSFQMQDSAMWLDATSESAEYAMSDAAAKKYIALKTLK